MPFRLGFDWPAEAGWWLFEVAISLFLLCDLVLNFFTAIQEGEEFVLGASPPLGPSPCPRLLFFLSP